MTTEDTPPVEVAHANSQTCHHPRSPATPGRADGAGTWLVASPGCRFTSLINTERLRWARDDSGAGKRGMSGKQELTMMWAHYAVVNAA